MCVYACVYACLCVYMFALLVAGDLNSEEAAWGSKPHPVSKQWGMVKYGIKLWLRLEGEEMFREGVKWLSILEL